MHFYYKNIIIIFLISCLFFPLRGNGHARWIDFDVAMKTDKYKHIINSKQNKDMLAMSGFRLLDFFRYLFNKNHPTKLIPSKTPKIPKIIHQIWIGESVPEQFKTFQKTWQEKHPDWQYKLWTQHDIQTLKLQNEEFILQSRNPGEISDMMRYEILYRYGGVYLDFDFECLQSIEELNYIYDFYIGIQPMDSELVQLGIGIIGSIQGHPILKQCIEKIKYNWHNKAYEQMATARTGPIYCTKIFYDAADQFPFIDIAFPSFYFYPLGCQEYQLKKEEWKKDGAFAVHHWAKSWLYPNFRRPEFQSIKNFN
jgi:mannosyltransferase OCH1-like enzyme